MVTQRGHLTHSLFLFTPQLLLSVIVASTLLSSTADAGPLFDWLCRRNRSRGLNTNPAAAPGATAGSPYAANNPTTAGYAPQGGGCGPGWCQETVVRYVPQIAYRTMYQPVPVTTYKTSTSINPATGLPRTCTRPCTSYNYQARRVPYTTYRPVYTTVPVADTLQAPPNVSGYAPQSSPGYSSAYAYQPPTSGGCSNCQNSGSYDGYGGGFSNWSNVPGYTPGDARQLPRATPWRSEGSAAGNGASPWRSEPAPSDRGYGNNGYSPTPWRSESSATPTRPPADGGMPADDRPRLRPEYPDDYGASSRESSFRPLQPKPMTEDVRRRLDEPSDDAAGASYRYDNGLGQKDNFAYSSDQELFRTPRQNGFAPARIRPPTNQSESDLERRFDEYYRGGIRERNKTDVNSVSGDKTALRRDRRSSMRPRGEMPLIEEPTRTRYASAPINWSSNRRARALSQPRRSRAAKAESSYSDRGRRQQSATESDWLPIR